MDNRERLIGLAIKYHGEYDLIKKAISNNEDCDFYECDNCITIFDDNYPRRLFNLKKPPFVLFYKGDPSLLDKKSIGVVGSRSPSDYALKATKRLVEKKKDMVVISGMAKGIDYTAGFYATNSIAILGSGIDYIYPSCNENLYHKLINEGLIISEYPGNSIPYAYHFPFRNRLIAALSDEIYVMEAHEKSGTLTTVNEALELGVNVKVLPFDVFNKSVINNNLIDEGASIILNNEFND